jgi:hypothetical protein
MNIMETKVLQAMSKNAINDALVSRGANKGMLKAKCPKVNTPGAAAWQAIMGFANPYKVGMCHIDSVHE